MNKPKTQVVDADKTAASQSAYDLQAALQSFGLTNPNINFAGFQRTVTPPSVGGSNTSVARQVMPQQPVSNVSSPLDRIKAISSGGLNTGINLTAPQPAVPQTQVVGSNMTTVTPATIDFRFGGGIDEAYGPLKAALAKAMETPLNALDSEAYGREYLSRLNEPLDRQRQVGEQQLLTRLATQGIVPGSQAYQNELAAFNEAYNRQLSSNQLAAMQQSQAAQAADYQLQEMPFLQYLNRYGSMNQIASPYLTVNSQGVAAPDYTNLKINQINQENAAAQARAAQQNALFGTIAGLGTSVLTGGLLSGLTGAASPTTDIQWTTGAMGPGRAASLSGPSYASAADALGAMFR